LTVRGVDKPSVADEALYPGTSEDEMEGGKTKHRNTKTDVQPSDLQTGIEQQPVPARQDKYEQAECGHKAGQYLGVGQIKTVQGDNRHGMQDDEDEGSRPCPSVVRADTLRHAGQPDFGRPALCVAEGRKPRVPCPVQYVEEDTGQPQ